MIYLLWGGENMSIIMNKELLVRVPSSLYNRVKHLCRDEYKSISALIRELLIEKLEESLHEDELAVVEKASKDFHKGKGVDWRKVKRG